MTSENMLDPSPEIDSEMRETLLLLAVQSLNLVKDGAAVAIAKGASKTESEIAGKLTDIIFTSCYELGLSDQDAYKVALQTAGEFPQMCKTAKASKRKSLKELVETSVYNNLQGVPTKIREQVKENINLVFDDLVPNQNDTLKGSGFFDALLALFNAPPTMDALRPSVDIPQFSSDPFVAHGQAVIPALPQGYRGADNLWPVIPKLENLESSAFYANLSQKDLHLRDDINLTQMAEEQYPHFMHPPNRKNITKEQLDSLSASSLYDGWVRGYMANDYDPGFVDDLPVEDVPLPRSEKYFHKALEGKLTPKQIRAMWDWYNDDTRLQLTHPKLSDQELQRQKDALLKTVLKWGLPYPDKNLTIPEQMAIRARSMANTKNKKRKEQIQELLRTPYEDWGPYQHPWVRFLASPGVSYTTLVLTMVSPYLGKIINKVWDALWMRNVNKKYNTALEERYRYLRSKAGEYEAVVKWNNEHDADHQQPLPPEPERDVKKIMELARKYAEDMTGTDKAKVLDNKQEVEEWIKPIWGAVRFLVGIIPGTFHAYVTQQRAAFVQRRMLEIMLENQKAAVTSNTISAVGAIGGALFTLFSPKVGQAVSGITDAAAKMYEAGHQKQVIQNPPTDQAMREAVERSMLNSAALLSKTSIAPAPAASVQRRAVVAASQPIQRGQSVLQVSPIGATKRGKHLKTTVKPPTLATMTPEMKKYVLKNKKADMHAVQVYRNIIKDMRRNQQRRRGRNNRH